MDIGDLTTRVVALHAQAAALGAELVASGHRLEPAEAYAVVGALQSVVNAAEGAQAVAAGFGARVEEKVTSTGVTRRVHPVGFADQMAGTEVALAAGVTEGQGWRKVRLGAELGSRFPRTRDRLLAGEVSAATAHRVVDGCEGLDVAACAAVDAALAPRLAGLDPAAVARTVRQVAVKVAAEQVAARVEARRRGRCVEVCPGEDGLASWWAVLPTATAAAAWSAVNEVAAQYREQDPGLSVPESRADAFGDLLLRNVTVTAKVTLGVPVLTGPDATTGSAGAMSEAPGWSRQRVDPGEDVLVDHHTGEVLRVGDLPAGERERRSWVSVPGEDHPCSGLPDAPTVDPRQVVSAGPADGSGLSGVSSVSGAELPGLGWVDAATVAAMFASLPIEVARAVLDAGTGTLVSLSTGAYTPTKAMRELVQTRDGTCRMWGCARAAAHVDLDHVKPWPAGRTSPENLAGLCRRHHRMKQRGRWRYTLHPDGTIDWVDPAGRRRRTEPAHRLVPRPERKREREPAPERGPAAAGGPRATSSDHPPPF